jgi:selenocysteine-specific elongation factor
VGASEVMGRVLLLDRDELRGGESCYAQMQLESFVCVLHGDRFVVRTFSPMETIGGGIVLVPNARKHKRFRAQVVNELQSIEQLGKTFQVEKAIYDSGLPLPLEEIKEKFHISDKDLLSSNNLVTVSYGGVTYVYHKGSYEKEKQKIKELLEKFHRDFPLREGMSKEELKEKVLKEAKGRQFDLLLSMLESDGLVTVKGQVVALKGFAPALSAKEEEMKETILRKLSQSHLKPIKEEEIVGSQAELSVLHFLIRSGDVVKLPSGEYLLGNQVEEAKKILVDYLKNHGQITLASFRDLLGVSRRDALALLEYFDSVKVTKRAGDVRVLA